MEHKRPLPHPSPLTAPHWDGAKQHKLMVQHCSDCGHHVFPPRPVCVKCFSAKLSWVESAGTGKIYSFTIVHRPPDLSFEAPYCIAIVRLDEGWFMTTNIVGSAPDAISIDAPVRVKYLDIDDMTLPTFEIIKNI